MRARPLLALLGLWAALLGPACGPEEPPTNPSWDIDVYPILRGNCLHCHGERTTAVGAVLRFDICDPSSTEFLLAGASNVGLGAALLATPILSAIRPSNGRPRMPPPPGVPLSEYDRKVLERWGPLAQRSAALACRKRVPNRAPVVKMIGVLRREGTSLFATLEVSDADDDQVAGRATAGGGSAELAFLGRRTIEVKNATGEHLEVKLSDGWDLTSVTY